MKMEGAESEPSKLLDGRMENLGRQSYTFMQYKMDEINEIKVSTINQTNECAGKPKYYLVTP